MGPVGLTAYKFTPRLEGVARFDYIYNRQHGGGLLGFGADPVNGIGPGFDGNVDADGNLVAIDSQRGANRFAFSVGGNYRFNEYTLFKAEYRLDRATSAFSSTSMTATSRRRITCSAHPLSSRSEP